MRVGGWRVGVCEHGVRGCAHPFEVRVGVQFRSHLLKRSELLKRHVHHRGALGPPESLDAQLLLEPQSLLKRAGEGCYFGREEDLSDVGKLFCVRGRYFGCGEAIREGYFGRGAISGGEAHSGGMLIRARGSIPGGAAPPRAR